MPQSQPLRHTVTAAHVKTAFGDQAEREGVAPEGYFLPAGKGVCLQPPLIQPPAAWLHPAPDVALRQIHDDLLGRIGKQAFKLLLEPIPVFPVPYAMAVGFPTLAKSTRGEPLGGRVEMGCVHAVAEGVGSPEHSDQVQFYSEIPVGVSVVSLSGMSGGPVFWSDGKEFGLLGFVKEALDSEPKPGEETIHAGPRVNFICQRACYEMFRQWAAYVETEWPKQREELNKSIKQSTR
jgi:hypothetical protein